MAYKRARVAITMNEAAKMVHVGHARTLLLGSLIAAEHGCPFHVRLDGIRRQYHSDTTYATLDVVNCLAFLGIQHDMMYWVSQRHPDLTQMESELGSDVVERVRQALSEPGVCPSEYPGTISDDPLIYHPSLIIRGMEFQVPEMYGGVDTTQGMVYTATEDMIFRAAGRDKHEVNTPLIVVDDGNKVSKRSSILIHWDCLVPMGRDVARDFLVATAVMPESPFEVMGNPFSSVDMTKRSYYWSWHDYAEAIRRS